MSQLGWIGGVGRPWYTSIPAGWRDFYRLRPDERRCSHRHCLPRDPLDRGGGTRPAPLGKGRRPLGCLRWRDVHVELDRFHGRRAQPRPSHSGRLRLLRHQHAGTHLRLDLTPAIQSPVPTSCRSGGIGRRARLRTWWPSRVVEVRVLSPTPAPNVLERHRVLSCPVATGSFIVWIV